MARCEIHPNKSARRRCSHCGTRICKRCRSYDRGRVFCTVCARAVDGGFASDVSNAVGDAYRGASSAMASAERDLSEALHPIRSRHEPSPLLAGVLSAVIPGLGQVYNGRIGKGMLVFLLSFLFIPYVIGIVDAAAEASRRARRFRAARYSLGALHTPRALPAWRPIPTPPAPPMRLKGNALQRGLLAELNRKGGELSVTDGVLATGASFDEVSTALDGLLHDGIVDIGNRPDTGVVVYTTTGARESSLMG